MAGRPSTFSQEVADAVCTELSGGERSLREICESEGFPSATTIYKWLQDFPQFAEQYSLARARQMEHMAEEILPIADDGRNDYMEREGYKVVDHEHIQRSKLRIDTRKWLMSKLAPKKYGDKLGLEHTGKDGGPIQSETTFPQMTPDKLREVIEKLEKPEGEA